MTTKPPIRIESFTGRASNRYAAAVTKPSGTRIRRAILFQLGSRVLQQTSCGSDHLIGCDVEQTRIRFAGVRERTPASPIPQHDTSCAVWAVARWVGRSEDCQHWDVQRGSEMQR